MRRLVLLLAGAAAFLQPLAAPAQAVLPALTLERALERAAARSPEIAAARRGVEAAEGAVRQAGARPNPTLNASVEDFRRDARTTTATLDLPLESGARRSARIAAAERARDVAQAEAANARAQVRAGVIAAYFQVLVAQERTRIAGSSVELAARGAEAASKRVAAGKVSPVEETRAAVDLANARLEAAEAAAELQAARLVLAAALGELAPDFNEVAAIAAGMPQRGAVPELLARLDAAPALQAARLEIERRRALVDVERARRHADLTLSVGAKRDNALGRTQAVVGISVPLPLVDRNEGAIYEAAQLAERAGDELQAARLRLASELQQAASRLAVARASATTLQDAVLPAATAAHQAATIGFEAGKFSFMEVLDAQRSLLAARARHLNALSAAWQAAASIDRIVGE
ncbi:TolC family protein [Ramlibacter alkalitolerans]|uniref:TolC family protein n=1 Tax=Ramlibacter alkalitolerans TaxID=2039631 RepID=A0ABS1JSB5_9BURK|nr:TolC family protein [Ramlibacter alkalitolerans]MBL0427165.1 TolC family protein [Ramlibacter alkalitolerans]